MTLRAISNSNAIRALLLPLLLAAPVAAAKTPSASTAAPPASSASAPAPDPRKTMLVLQNLRVEELGMDTRIGGKIVNMSGDICRGPMGEVFLVAGGKRIANAKLTLPGQLKPKEVFDFSVLVSSGIRSAKVETELVCRAVEKRESHQMRDGKDVFRLRQTGGN